MNPNAEILSNAQQLAVKLQESLEYATGLEGDIKSAKQTIDTQAAEIENLKKARSKPEPVVLQKVASADQQTLDKTLDMLVQHEVLAESDREKLANTLRNEGPNAMLRLTQQVVAITAPLPVPSVGRGIEKEAGAKTVNGTVSPEFGSAQRWLEG